MLTAQQKSLIHAIEQLDLEQVKRLLDSGLDPNFLDIEKGPPISVLSNMLFNCWDEICAAYDTNQPLSENEKNNKWLIYLSILETLIQARANLHLWDADELYGPLWDAASSCCLPFVQRLLDEKVDPNTRDDEGLTILSSISELFFDCDFDQIDWTEALPEEKQTLHLLREYGAKMSKELL